VGVGVGVGAGAGVGVGVGRASGSCASKPSLSVWQHQRATLARKANKLPLAIRAW